MTSIADTRPWKERKTEYFTKYMEKYNSIKVECSCGKMVAKGMINRHQTSKFHKFNSKSI